MFKKSKSLTISMLIGASVITYSALGGCAMKQNQETIGQYVDASVTSTQVKTEILKDKSLSNTTITVKTYKNVIQLSGFVNNYTQKMRAEEIARNVGRVTTVENSIIVKK